MKKHSLLSASPEVNGELLRAAYANLRDRFQVMVLEMESLNKLLNEARDSADKIIFPDNLVKIVRQYKEAGDDLTAAMIEGALLLDKLNQAVIYHATAKKS